MIFPYFFPFLPEIIIMNNTSLFPIDVWLARLDWQLLFMGQSIEEFLNKVKKLKLKLKLGAARIIK